MVVTANRHSQTQQDKEQALVLWFEDVGEEQFAPI
jgi:pyruvate, water dikinase